MAIGEKIKRAREKAHYSQETLAEKLDVTRQTISKWENNVTHSSTNNLLTLARLLNISFDELVSIKVDKVSDEVTRIDYENKKLKNMLLKGIIFLVAVFIFVQLAEPLFEIGIEIGQSLAKWIK